MQLMKESKRDVLNVFFYRVDNVEQSLEPDSSRAISLPKDAVLGKIRLLSAVSRLQGWGRRLEVMGKINKMR